ncbi:MAG: hypothetical protein RIA69_07355 [Cyclobacteriaceae bacterium]
MKNSALLKFQLAVQKAFEAFYAYGVGIENNKKETQWIGSDDYNLRIAEFQNEFKSEIRDYGNDIKKLNSYVRQVYVEFLFFQLKQFERLQRQEKFQWNNDEVMTDKFVMEFHSIQHTLKELEAEFKSFLSINANYEIGEINEIGFDGRGKYVPSFELNEYNSKGESVNRTKTKPKNIGDDNETKKIIIKEIKKKIDDNVHVLLETDPPILNDQNEYALKHGNKGSIAAFVDALRLLSTYTRKDIVEALNLSIPSLKLPPDGKTVTNVSKAYNEFKPQLEKLVITKRNSG